MHNAHFRGQVMHMWYSHKLGILKTSTSIYFTSYWVAWVTLERGKISKRTRKKRKMGYIWADVWPVSFWTLVSERNGEVGNGANGFTGSFWVTETSYNFQKVLATGYVMEVRTVLSILLSGLLFKHRTKSCSYWFHYFYSTTSKTTSNAWTH